MAAIVQATRKRTISQVVGGLAKRSCVLLIWSGHRRRFDESGVG
jgi:hypothetical protein